MQDEIAYKLLKIIENEPQLSQREIAARMGISLGKANYCLKSLIEKGFIKARNFYNSNHKVAYVYMLTPSGLEEKASVTYRFQAFYFGLDVLIFLHFSPQKAVSDTGLFLQTTGGEHIDVTNLVIAVVEIARLDKASFYQ